VAEEKREDRLSRAASDHPAARSSEARDREPTDSRVVAMSFIADFGGNPVFNGRSNPGEKRRRPMCANCGCGIPEEKHGDDRNIAWSEIVASAEANDISPTEAVRNMQKMSETQG
jgi:hypothetical protein